MQVAKLRRRRWRFIKRRPSSLALVSRHIDRFVRKPGCGTLELELSTSIVYRSIARDINAAMASTRTSVVFLSLIALMLVAECCRPAAAHPDLQRQQANQVTAGSAKQFYLRGDVVSQAAENERTAVEKNLESFERRELSNDYGSTYSAPNCSGHC